MTVSMSARVRQALAVLEDMHTRRLEHGTRSAYLADLAGYSESQVLGALIRCRRELSRFPTVADILARIDDGHPGAEEAWALIPKSQADSAVMTAPMRAAYAAAYSLIESGDVIAARMAFREKYLTELANARNSKQVAKWTPSLGQDPSGRDHVLRQAVDLGRMSAIQAASLLPGATTSPDHLRLVSPGSEANETQARVMALIGSISKDMPRESRMLAARTYEDRRKSDETMDEDQTKDRIEFLKRQAVDATP